MKKTKIILSRKGMDSKYGGIPSPIMPDGTLLSLPIPYPGDCNKYSGLSFGNHKYSDIIKELNGKPKFDTCHLDPDIREDVKARKKGWKPSFGQHHIAQSHLKKSGVAEGDIFLFFGWYNFTKSEDGILQFKDYPKEGFHAIYGYLKIKEMFPCNCESDYEKLPEWLRDHPHADFAKYKPNNMIYVSNNESAGCFKFNDNLILTKSGQPKRSKWELPKNFHPDNGVELSYNKTLSLWKPPIANKTILETKRGQEFVVLEDPQCDVENWAKNLIKSSEKI